MTRNLKQSRTDRERRRKRMIPIAIKIESAKGEIMNAIQRIQNAYDLPPCIMDGVLSSVLAEVRSEAKIELINAANAMMREQNEELEKAKAAAKTVLKAESEDVSESDTVQ
jgi:hypothetical protein